MFAIKSQTATPPSSMTLLLNCAIFGFFSGTNRKSTFNSFSLTPASFPPPGHTKFPARSSSEDGVHRRGDYVGPTFDPGLYVTLDDDCTAVHGPPYQIQGAGSSTNLFIVPTGEVVLGDGIRFYSYGSVDILVTTTVSKPAFSLRLWRHRWIIFRTSSKRD